MAESSEAGTRIGLVVDALLEHLAGPERARALEALGGRSGPVPAAALAAALRAAGLARPEARRVGLTAASAVDLALAARLAGVGSTERAIRQADRLLPREHPDGSYEVEALDAGEARVSYRTADAVDPLLCGVREGLLAGLPRCFGASAARVEETECGRHGGGVCRYRIRWSRSLADQPLSRALLLGGCGGGLLGTTGWLVSLASPLGAVALFAAGGIGAAAWLVESQRAARLGQREGIVAELESRIADRMDALAKLDAMAVRPEGGERASAPAAAPSAELVHGLRQLQQEVAGAERELAAARGALVAAGDGGAEAFAAPAIEALDERLALLRKLADGVLAGAPAPSGRREREDLSALLGDVVHRARRVDGNGPEITLSMPADLPFVHCDGAGIARALRELLAEACRASGAGGRVHVEATAVEDGVELSVRDDGNGADPADVEESLDPFHAAPEANGAADEGLRLAARIVAEHRSTLLVQADAQSGTRASFVLPSEPR